MADEYNIKITTQGDAKGAEAVAAGLQKVGKAAGETGKGARQLGDELATLGSRQNAAKDVVEGLDSALKGNAGSFWGVAKAAKNLWEILTVSTPMGRLIQLAAVAGSAVALFGEKLFGAGKSAEEASKKIDTFGEAMKKAGDARSVALTKQITALKDEAKAAADQLARIIDMRDRIETAEANVEKARINAADELSPDEKRRQIAQVELEAARKRRHAEDEKLGNEYRTAERLSGDTAAAQDDVASQLEKQKAAIATQEQRRALEIELQNLNGVSGDSPQEMRLRGIRMMEIREQLQASESTAVSPEVLAAQKQRVATLEADYEKVSKAAADAAAALERLNEDVVSVAPDGRAVRYPDIQKLRGLEDDQTRIEGGLSVPTYHPEWLQFREKKRIDPGPIVKDGASMRAMGANGGKTGAEIAAEMRAIVQGGAESGAEIARVLAETMKAREAALMEKMREQIKTLQR